jgi:hypothetical protein
MGTTNRIGAITHAAKLIVQHQNYATCHLFLVADIGEDDLILGYPFFEATNPTIDWVKGELTGEVTLSSEEDWEQLLEADKGTLFHARIAKTTVAQQLAEQATDKKERTWQEQVPEAIPSTWERYSQNKRRNDSLENDDGIMLST